MSEETPALGPRFAEALTWAHELHRAQVRKGTPIPYVSHLLSVAALVLEHGGDEESAIAGLLHDAVEDQGGAPVLAEIRRRFGQRVADVVAGCTDTDVVPKPPWRARKEAYLAHLEDASPDVLLVSACDKLHNARATLADHRVAGDAHFERFRGKKEGTLWYYGALAEAFQRLRPGRLANELSRVVRAMHERARAGTVRVAQPGDEGEIARVHVRAWQGGYAGLMPDALLDRLNVAARTELWRERLEEHADSPITHLVHVEDERVTGFVSLGPTRDEDLDGSVVGEIGALYVIPSGWGSGAGRLLLTSALERLRALGHTRVTLWSLAGNVRAERFYAAAGFAPEGATKSVKKDGASLEHCRWARSLGTPEPLQE